MELLAGVPPIHRYLALMLRQAFSRPTLQRRPEPRALTDQVDNVLQYDQVMTSRLVIAYAAGIETIYRARREPFGGSAIDLACGPGHFSLCMAQHLKLTSLVGVDLSAPMIEVAAQNARNKSLSQAQFQVGDITQLDEFRESEFDLSTLTDAAHHLNDLEAVRETLADMDRITKPDGLVFLMDLARLNTEKITTSFVNLVGRDYKQRGLGAFLSDFRHSMFAAWRVEELRTAAPAMSKRNWMSLRPRILPTIQMIVGVPLEQTRLRIRRGVPWKRREQPVVAEFKREWQMMRASLNSGETCLLPH